MTVKAENLKKTELSRFLEQYMKNRRLSDTPQSYREFLIGEGRDSRGDAEGDFRAALRSYAKEAPTYGAEGEALARRGLEDSGYAAAEATDAERTLLSEKIRIDSEREAAEKKNQSDYAKYLKNHAREKASAESAGQKEDLRRREELIETFYKYHIEDYESARAYAEGIGYGDSFSRELFDAAMVLIKYRGSLEVINGSR